MCKRSASGVPFNICMFYLVPLIKEIEKVIQKKEVPFSSFVIQTSEYALRDMEDKK